MNYIKVIEGSLLDSDAEYIAHQTNCISNGSAAGIARLIFDAYPHADTYKNRTVAAQPGTIDIMGTGDQRKVLNLNSQYYPGGLNNDKIDDRAARENYFYKCLLKIAKLPECKSVAFPAGIGCAIAQGDWEYYLGTIKNFAKYMYEKHGTITYIYKLPNSPFDCQ